MSIITAFIIFTANNIIWMIFLILFVPKDKPTKLPNPFKKEKKVERQEDKITDILSTGKTPGEIFELMKQGQQG